MKKIAIIGSGMMGSALVWPAFENSNEVRLVGTPLDRDIIDECKKSNRHPKFDRAFPEGVKFYQFEQWREAAEGADFVIGGVSSFGVDWFLDEVLSVLDPGIPVLSVTKGLMNLDDGTLISYPDYWQRELAKKGICREVCAIGCLLYTSAGVYVSFSSNIRKVESRSKVCFDYAKAQAYEEALHKKKMHATVK